MSREHVAAQYVGLPDGDSRKTLLDKALTEGETFYVSMGDKGPTYQWTNAVNKNVSYSLSLDVKSPGATAAKPFIAITINTRTSLEETVDQMRLIADPSKRAEAFKTIGWNEEKKAFAETGILVSRSVTDGPSEIDGEDPVYQFGDTKDPNTSYTLSIKTGIPAGDPSVNTGTEATWGINTRVGAAEVAAWLNNNALTLIATGVTVDEAIAAGETFYLSRSSLTDVGQYQWTSFTDPNVSFSLQVKADEAPAGVSGWVAREPLQRINQMTLSKTTQVSARDVAVQLAAAISAGTITAGDSRKAAIEAAIADGLSFFMTAGEKGPNFQWASDSDKNKSFSLGVDTKFPVGEGATAGFRTELSLTTSVRASLAEVQNKLSLIADESDRAEARSQLGNAGMMVTKSFTDGVDATDGLDPSYQFSDLTDPDTSYSIAIKSGIPLGLPNEQGAYTSFGSEAMWNISKRVGKADVSAWIVKQGYDLVNDGDVDTAAALSDSALYYWSRSGMDDTEGQFQWASVSDPNTSYSLLPRNDYAQVVLNASTQVSRETVRKELDDAVAAGTITAQDSRYQKIVAAIAAGASFIRTTGEKGPSYQWASSTDKNTSYSLAVDEHFPSDAGLLTQLSITVSTRVSAATAYAEAQLISNPADRQEARDLDILKDAVTTEARGISTLAVNRSVTDGVSSQDGVDASYQFSDPEDGDISYTIGVRSGLPVDDPEVDRAVEVTWTINTRVTRATIEALINDYIKKAEESDLAAKVAELNEALGFVAMGREIYWSRSGQDDTVGQYQWTDIADPNVSYSLLSRPGFEEATLTVTTQVSRSVVAAQIAVLTASYDLQRAEIEAEIVRVPEQAVALGEALTQLQTEYDANKRLIENALLDADGGMFSTSQQIGSADVTYNWSSAGDRNLSYGLSTNAKVPFGFTNSSGVLIPFRTEVSFTRNQRVSRSALEAKAALIPDAAKKAKALESIAAIDLAGGAFSQATTDLKDPVYQWSDPASPDESWSMSYNPRVPQGIPDADTGVYRSYAPECAVTHSVRVKEAEVREAIATIKDPVKKLAAEAALTAAILENTGLYKSQVLAEEDPTYQWSNKSDTNTSFSVSVNAQVPSGLQNANGTYPEFVTETTYP